MKARHLGTLALAVALTVPALAGCRRGDAATPAQMKARIQTLEKERDELRAKLGALFANDKRFAGMPQDGVRVGVPTSLATTLIQRVITGFVDSVTLRLANLRVHKSGTIKKIITIGAYDLTVAIDDVTGHLQASTPDIVFGDNKVTVSLPVRVASGSGDATIDFTWDGKNISGAVCGDMQVRQKVSGKVKPNTYPVRGGLQLAATSAQILASPRFPPLTVNLKVEPSAQSWAAVQAILDSKGGICGYVLDKVDIPGVLDRRADHDRREGQSPGHHGVHDLDRRGRLPRDTAGRRPDEDAGRGWDRAPAASI